MENKKPKLTPRDANASRATPKSHDPLVHLVDYYLLSDGRMVFTEAYHLKRGFCCKSNCLHCPYDFEDRDIENPGASRANLASQEIAIQCPFCFETFTIVASASDGEIQSFVYDCEVCCRPIDLTVEFSGPVPRVRPF